MTREWDAATYARVAQPHGGWATEVLHRLDLEGDEVVLDAGCGSGKVTEQLLALVPRGRVIGVDASARMLAEARSRLSGHLARLELVQADLARPLPLDVTVDAVVSSATFHWIADHPALFANLAAVLRPGGRLSAQCGGAGNIASVARALAAIGYAGPDPWHFASPEEAAADLGAAGFVDVEAWLIDAHIQLVAEADRQGSVRAVASRLAHSTIDYVRLNLVARRA